MINTSHTKEYLMKLMVSIYIIGIIYAIFYEISWGNESRFDSSDYIMIKVNDEPDHYFVYIEPHHIKEWMYEFNYFKVINITGCNRYQVILEVVEK